VSLYERISKENINVIIFVVLLVPVALLLVLKLTGIDYPIIDNAFLLFMGALISQFILALKTILTARPEKRMCTYQKQLKEFGVKEIYISERCDEYRKSLENDFDKAKGRKPFRKKREIVMMGVSLQNFFISHEDDIFKKIEAVSNEVQFRVFLCSPNNEALADRKKWVENELKTRKDIVIADIIGETPSKIESTKSLINSLKDVGHKITVDEYTKTIPFATIIFVNNNIYYTPNMFKPENWGIKFKKDYKSPECPEANLSLCISRTSSFGRKLVKMFDIVYSYTNMT